MDPTDLHLVARKDAVVRVSGVEDGVRVGVVGLPHDGGVDRLFDE